MCSSLRFKLLSRALAARWSCAAWPEQPLQRTGLEQLTLDFQPRRQRRDQHVC